MKTLLFSLMTMLGVAFSNAGDTYLDFTAEEQQFYRGLGRAKDAFSTTLSTEQAVGGFNLNAQASLIGDSEA